MCAAEIRKARAAGMGSRLKIASVRAPFPDTAISGRRVARDLTALIARHGGPAA